MVSVVTLLINVLVAEPTGPLVVTEQQYLSIYRYTPFSRLTVELLNSTLASALCNTSSTRLETHLQMSTPESSVAAQFTLLDTVYQQQQFLRSLICALTWLTYDIMLTIGQEAEHVWRLVAP